LSKIRPSAASGSRSKTAAQLRATAIHSTGKGPECLNEEENDEEEARLRVMEGMPTLPTGVPPAADYSFSPPPPEDDGGGGGNVELGEAEIKGFLTRWIDGMLEAAVIKAEAERLVTDAPETV
jgi:hypothetical protein